MLTTSTRKVEHLLGRMLFEQMPFKVAVIDREFRVLAANANFEAYFGDWRNRHCYEVYKGSCQRCPRCQAEATFTMGVSGFPMKPVSIGWGALAIMLCILPRSATMMAK